MKNQFKTSQATIAAACLTLAGIASAAPATAPTVGQTYFEQNCASCHTVDAKLSSRAGPGLYNVIGRKAAGVPGFNYTDALTKAGAAGKTWTREELDLFLRDPNKNVPGTAMPIGVADPARRAAVIDYLATQSGKAAAPAAASVKAAATSDAAAWTADKPGDMHHIKPADLVAPYGTESAGNGPKLAARPDGAMPAVPNGFKVGIYADGLGKPRLPLRAPNGDLFLSEAAKGQITILRAANGSGGGDKASSVSVYATGLSRPYGMAFWPSASKPQYLYVANVNSVVRFPYSVGDQAAKGEPEVVIEKISDTSGGHVTRTIAFSNDGKTLFLSVGSATNYAPKIGPTPPQPLAQWEAKYGVGAAWGEETERAAVLAFDADGRNRRPYANGLRNCVGMLVHPTTGDLFCSVNERDELGDNLAPDYITRVKKDGFYGWPWYYIGANEDPRLKGIRPDLGTKVLVPDTLIQSHSAPLGMVVYQAPKGAKFAFPKQYEGDIFVALHGSWNRSIRTGYKVVRVLMKNGVPTGQYQDFMTGMVLSDRDVWGRPAAVEVAADGALLVVDDGGGVVWRITPEK
jgi:glucose/arabinose dehydrogenase